MGFGVVAKFNETMHIKHSSHVVIALLMPDLGPGKADQHLLNTVVWVLVVFSFFSEPRGPPKLVSISLPWHLSFFLITELPSLLSFQPGQEGMSCSLPFTNSHLLFFF